MHDDPPLRVRKRSQLWDIAPRKSTKNLHCQYRSDPWEAGSDQA
jgi:hypothetical protein